MRQKKLDDFIALIIFIIIFIVRSRFLLFMGCLPAEKLVK